MPHGALLYDFFRDQGQFLFIGAHVT
jgi:hypothetical protein